MKEYKFTHASITDVGTHFEESLYIRITIQWAAEDIGFGYVYLKQDANEKLTIESEAMSDDFVKALLSFMVSKATIEGEGPEVTCDADGSRIGPDGSSA